MRWTLPLLLLALAAVGCSAKLETGYEPRKLGTSDNVRRGYYATPFTPEANAAAQDRDRELEMRRPNRY